MIKVTESTAIAELLSEFEPTGNGAQAILGMANRKTNAYRAWSEFGEVYGTPARIIWKFGKMETKGIRRESLPFDKKHIKEIQIAEHDDTGEFEDF